MTVTSFVGAHLLVHFLDGSTQACAQDSEWVAFSHEGEKVEWCEATSMGVARVMAIRLRNEHGPVLGVSVTNEEPLSDANARAALDAHGGREALRPPPSIQPLRRMSERPKEQPWFGSLTKLGFISDEEITHFMSQVYRVPTVDLDKYEVELEVVMLLTKEQCEAHHIVPVACAGNSLIVAMADPTNIHAIDAVKEITGLKVEPVIASDEAIRIAIVRYYG